MLSWLPFGQAVEKVMAGPVTESVSVAAILKADVLLLTLLSPARAP